LKLIKELKSSLRISDKDHAKLKKGFMIGNQEENKQNDSRNSTKTKKGEFAVGTREISPFPSTIRRFYP